MWSFLLPKLIGIEQDRYCLDIYHQITATQCVLKKANKEIMTAHMYHCVKEAFEHGEDVYKRQSYRRVIIWQR